MINNLHTLLQKQIRKNLGEIESIPPALEGFFMEVNDAYKIFERDKKLSDHAFKISEDQFQKMNHKMAEELNLKRIHIRKLLENNEYYNEDTDRDRFGDDLDAVAELISVQFAKLKEAEKKLQSSEQKFKDALEKIGDNVWELNLETDEFTFLHNSNSRHIEGKANALERFLSWDQLFEEDVKKILDIVIKYKSFEIDSHQVEYRVHGPDNSIRWYLDRGGRIGSKRRGEGSRVIGTLSEITERKKIEKALLISEEKYRGIIENMNLGLLEVDSHETILYANESFANMSGFSKKELINKKPKDLFLRLEDSEFMESKIIDREKGVSDTYEIKVRSKDNQEKWWLISGAPLKDEFGKVVGSLGIHLDITDQKELQKNLVSAKQEALLLAEAKDSFLANMSHELRTPMNGIIGIVRDLQRKEENPQKAQRLQSISGAADHLMSILNDILDLSRINSGKMKLEKIGFNLNELVHSTIEVLESRASEKGLILKSQLAQMNDCFFIGDPFRLKQILLNLLGNAIKFTEKGFVSLEIASTKISAAEAELVLKVTDTGIGMDENFISRLFNKFEQEDSSVVRRFGGTGLGLSITRELVDLMEGKIEISSKKNEGSIFSVTIQLPLRTENEGELIKENQVIQNALKGHKVLLVEDNELNREVALISLEFMGLEVVVAENGLLALDLIQIDKFSAVLMDLQMPIMDGFETTKKIREDLKQELPIIALSANVLSAEKEKCIACGMNDFVTKPFEEIDLFLSLYKCIYHKLPEVVADKNPVLAVDSSEKMYDLEKLIAMSRGDQAFVKKVLELFIESSQNTRVEFQSFLDGRRDMSLLQKTAHKIKPVLLNLGMKKLYETANWIENLDKDNEFSKEQIEPRLSWLTNQLKVVENSIRENELGS